MLEAYTVIDLVTILESFKTYCNVYTYDPSFFRLVFARIQQGMQKMEVKYRIKPLMSTMTACKRMRYNDPVTVQWICESALEVFD